MVAIVGFLAPLMLSRVPALSFVTNAISGIPARGQTFHTNVTTATVKFSWFNTSTSDTVEHNDVQLVELTGLAPINTSGPALEGILTPLDLSNLTVFNAVPSSVKWIALVSCTQSGVNTPAVIQAAESLGASAIIFHEDAPSTIRCTLTNDNGPIAAIPIYTVIDKSGRIVVAPFVSQVNSFFATPGAISEFDGQEFLRLTSTASATLNALNAGQPSIQSTAPLAVYVRIFNQTPPTTQSTTSSAASPTERSTRTSAGTSRSFGEGMRMIYVMMVGVSAWLLLVV